MKRIQTRVSADLTKYTENFFFGMSLRQTLLSAAGAAATALSYVFAGLPGILAACIGLPFFALAFLRPDGMQAEKFVCHWLKARILRPRVRCNIPQNDLYEFLWRGKLLGRTVWREKKGGDDS